MAIENRGPELQAVGITLVSFAIFSTLLRCYVRLFMVKSFGFDDWCMLFALINFGLFVGCALVGVAFGTGRHHKDLQPHDIEIALKYWWLCYLWYCLSMMASKLSIGSFLLRITLRRLHVWIIYIVMVITVMTGAVFFFVTLFQCNPVWYFWDKNVSGGTCVDPEVIMALTYLYSVLSVICDFTFAFLPMFIIWKLNMNKRTKFALFPIMAMGCVASAAVLVRFPYIKDFKNPDFLWATLDIAIWSTTEQGLAITAGSLATLRPLLRTIGNSLGISWSGPTELVDPVQSPPATIGQFSSSKKSRRGPFSLTTFMRDDGVELHSNPDEHSDHNGSQPPLWKGPVVSTKQRKDEEW
ncbi:unnamed protein product [Clonostachys rosea f. rosea IK726]|uniref:Rhodopsin domain-containing protein n=2 Tax=Bionectria ochroleuca TaxID=29856 RepID=A0A0B7KFR2_BIOOC|nr:unnamed protein product [Clonostachys rosea f. rosea IK726]